jgi:hypothetical protein
MLVTAASRLPVPDAPNNNTSPVVVKILHAFRDAVEQARVLGAAMIDERLRHRGQHWFGNGHGSRDEQQALLHGFGRSWLPPKR